MQICIEYALLQLNLYGFGPKKLTSRLSPIEYNHKPVPSFVLDAGLADAFSNVVYV